MKRPWLVDLCCCGGGASMGLARAGFNVVGVDVEPQRHYPFPFLQADVTKLDPAWLMQFDAAWASPPCQRFTTLAKQMGTDSGHPDLIDPVRALLTASGIPWVMENVPTAPLRNDLMLCGAMFGLRVVRHRVFETSGFAIDEPAHGAHAADYVTVTGHTGGTSKRDGSAHYGNAAAWNEAMGIDWLPASKVKEAVPPAYAEYIGAAMLQSMSRAVAA